MADNKKQKVEIEFIDFKSFERGSAKLAWVLAVLDDLKIKYVADEETVHPQLVTVRVSKDDLVSVQELIEMEVSANIRVTLDDIHPQHSFFTRDMMKRRSASDEDTVTADEIIAENPIDATGVTAPAKEPWDEGAEEEATGDTAEANAEGKAAALGLENGVEDDDESDDDLANFLEDEDDEEDDEDDVVEEPEPEIELVEGKEYLAAEQVLTHSTVEIPGSKQPVTMFEMPSDNLREFGFKPLVNVEGKNIVYASFKTGNTMYRYKEISNKVVNNILSEAVKRALAEKKGAKTTASAGSLFSTTIRAGADEGKYKCARLTDEGKWFVVLTKAQKKAAKEKK